MLNPSDHSFQALLDGMEGVSYVVVGDGCILACGHRNWTKFARENGGNRIADPATVVGRPILDFIIGDDVAAAHRGYLTRLLSGSIDAVTFEFRCDAPDLRRDLWMSIRPLQSAGRASALLYQSIIVDELPRPPMNLFDFEALRVRTAGRSTRPIVRLCAYCAKVATSATAGEDPDWIPPEDYYRKGGDSDVRISHGVCADCHGRHVAPFLADES